jgi:hypothetical protein
MMATDGNIDGSSVQRTILKRDTDHAELHRPTLCQVHSKLRRHFNTVHLSETKLDKEIIEQDRNHRSWTTINRITHHLLTYLIYVQGNSWTEIQHCCYRYGNFVREAHIGPNTKHSPILWCLSYVPFPDENTMFIHPKSLYYHGMRQTSYSPYYQFGNIPNKHRLVERCTSICVY